MQDLYCSHGLCGIYGRYLFTTEFIEQHINQIDLRHLYVYNLHVPESVLLKYYDTVQSGYVPLLQQKHTTASTIDKYHENRFVDLWRLLHLLHRLGGERMYSTDVVEAILRFEQNLSAQVSSSAADEPLGTDDYQKQWNRVYKCIVLIYQRWGVLSCKVKQQLQSVLIAFLHDYHEVIWPNCSHGRLDADMQYELVRPAVFRE
jgi:hypothetical protein